MGRGARLNEELYTRGMATVIASWAEYARGARGASLRRLPGVTAAVFPEGPERAVYNNAVLARAEAVDAMEAAYADAGVERFAAWAHERDAPIRGELERRGYAVVESTSAMGMPLTAARPARADIELRAASWAEYLRVDDLPEGILAGIDPEAFYVVVGCLEGVAVAAGIAYDHEGDCGVYNVGTRAHARGRGVGAAVTAALVRDLGRILEYGPPGLGPETVG